MRPHWHWALHYTIQAKVWNNCTIGICPSLHFLSYIDFKEIQTLNMVAAQEAGLPPGEDFTLANFSYANSVVVERMFHHLKNPGFLGISVGSSHVNITQQCDNDYNGACVCL